MIVIFAVCLLELNVMIKKLFVTFLLCFPFFMKAQYTEIINSNRPGFSESPFSVGTGIYQFETSLFYRNIESTPLFSNPKSLGVNLHFRTSFLLEKLELNVTTSLQNDKIAFKNVFESTHNETGFGELTLGAKYLIYMPKYTDKSKEIRSWKKRHAFDFRRWIPNVAVYAGINMGGVLNNYYKRGGSTQKFGLLLQNDFSNQFNVVTNFYYNYSGSNNPEYSYIITGTYTFNEKWSGFAEHQALFNKVEKQNNLGGGIAYLYDDNLQFNTSLRANFRDKTVGYYASIGVSYRIDRHIDDYIEIEEFDEEGNRIVKKETHKKGFWGKIFGKVGSEDSEEEKIEEKSSDPDAKLSRREKRRKKREERRLKRTEEKRLRKEEKRKQKELDDLDEEIRRLDEELKKEEEKERKKKEKEDK